MIESFVTKCPFLQRASISTIRTLATAKVLSNGMSTSGLMAAAHKCPVMAKALDVAKMVSGMADKDEAHLNGK